MLCHSPADACTYRVLWRIWLSSNIPWRQEHGCALRGLRVRKRSGMCRKHASRRRFARRYCGRRQGFVCESVWIAHGRLLSATSLDIALGLVRPPGGLSMPARTGVPCRWCSHGAATVRGCFSGETRRPGRTMAGPAVGGRTVTGGARPPTGTRPGKDGLCQAV